MCKHKCKYYSCRLCDWPDQYKNCNIFQQIENAENKVKEFCEDNIEEVKL